MKVRNFIKSISAGALFSALAVGLLIAQSSGTPSQIRVLTDANGYLLVASTSQTNPISQPTVFTNTRLKTDSSGNLLVVLVGGGGGGTPGGSDTQVQYNDATAFGGASGLLYDDVLNAVRFPLWKSIGTPGTYTLANSGIQFKNTAGDEIGRIWFTDPDLDGDYNARNLYIGYQPGLSQPTDNVDAGYDNTGLGNLVLSSITTGYDNFGGGSQALVNNTAGFNNVALGQNAASRTTTGNNVIAIGTGSGPTNGNGGISNIITIGQGTTTSTSNTTVIGNTNTTDTYLGGVTADSNLHFKIAQPTTGYNSSDGSSGVTVTACTGFKNGLCISGT